MYAFWDEREITENEIVELRRRQTTKFNIRILKKKLKFGQRNIMTEENHIKELNMSAWGNSRIFVPLRKLFMSFIKYLTNGFDNCY